VRVRVNPLPENFQLSGHGSEQIQGTELLSQVFRAHPGHTEPITLRSGATTSYPPSGDGRKRPILKSDGSIGPPVSEDKG
jgi:hypothetical protein